METFELRDIILEATAEVQEVIREVMEDLTAPMVREQIRRQWATMPDEMKEQFMRENPEEYRILMEDMERR